MLLDLQDLKGRKEKSVIRARKEKSVPQVMWDLQAQKAIKARRESKV